MLLITAMAGMAAAVIVYETTFPTNSLTLIGAGDIVTNLAATTTSSGGNSYGSSAESISDGDDGRLNIITCKTGEIGGAGVLLDSSLCTAHAEKPNVLFIIADDLMKQVELYGNDAVKTPRLNQLATEGLLFDRAYCQYPLCGPSRAAMMLSTFPNKSGITWNQGGKSAVAQKQAARLNVQTMPAYFRQYGYITVGGGKLYHDSVIPDSDSAQHDFKVAFEPTGKDGLKVQAAKGVKLTNITEASDHGIYEHKDGHLVQQAREWLDQHGQEKPFFMCIGLKKPHSPFSAPKQFFELYDRDAMRISTVQAPDNILEHYSLSKSSALLSVHADTKAYTADTLPNAKKMKIIHGYSACVAYMDHLVGDLIDSLKKNGLYDNTIIVFTSDHGYKLGEYNRWAKYTVHEKDTVVPLLVRVPQLPQAHGQTTKAIVGLIDLYPTLAELCGLPAPKKLDGVSFAKTLQNPNSAERSYVHTFVTRAESDHPAATGASIMHQNGYRFTQWSQEKATDFPGVAPVGIELYDHYHQNDTPLSLRNIAADHPGLAEFMKTHCRKVK